MMTGTGFLAVAAREAADRTKAEMQIEAEKAKVEFEKAKKELKMRTVMLDWHKGTAIDIIAAFADLPVSDVKKMVVSFEKVKAHFQSQPAINMRQLKQISGLEESHLKILLQLLQRH